MTSLPSEAFSTTKELQEIVEYGIVDLSPSQYRRQVSPPSMVIHDPVLIARTKIEHFEYYWGLQRCTLDLSLPMNHMRRKLSFCADMQG